MKIKEVIHKIKAEYDIADYMRESGLGLISSNGNTWKALCPFHNEKTPSFVVNEDFQNYRCFGCGEHGDIINFAEKIHSLSTADAIKLLAEEKGIDIGQVSESTVDVKGIKAVVADAAAFYQDNFNKLPDVHAAKTQISKRNLKLNNKLYGYSLEKPNELYKFLKAKGHSDENIKESKLVTFFDEPGRAPWDFFHGRLMITLSDYMGHPVSFTARKLFENDKMQGKYVNGKESPVFLKKNNLFGADTAKKEANKQKTIYVVEGQFDKESLYENGVENVVAASGTAFTQEHANLLLRMVGSTGKIIFVLDGDSAGVKAALKIFASSPVIHNNSHAVLLENGQDPCDFILENGIEAMKSKLENSIPLADFVVNSIINSLGGKITIHNRSEFVSEVCNYAKMSSSKQITEGMLSKASMLSAFTIESVRETFERVKSGVKVSSNKKEEPKEDIREKESIKIKMNSSSEADMCMYNSLSLLVRMPDKMLSETPQNIHKKFRLFVKEIKDNYEKLISDGKSWRFVVEDYTDSGFAQTLIDNNIPDPREDEKESILQYKYLFNKANEIYKYEYEEFKKSQALSSIASLTDPKEIAAALKFYMESK